MKDVTGKYSIVVYDIEILKAIPPKNDKDRIEGIDYCDGWHDHANMGITVIGAYDYLEDRYRVFTKDNFKAFFDLLVERKYRVGFNNINFDDKVLFNNGLLPYGVGQPYDILREVWRGAGLDPTVFVPSTHGGFSLDAIAEVNLGQTKSGNGALAAILWQQGKYGEVIDYCLNDVALTKKLLDLIFVTGGVRHPKQQEWQLDLRSLFEVSDAQEN